MAGACAHIDRVQTIVQPKAHACEECVKIGAQWVHLRTCQQCGKPTAVPLLDKSEPSTPATLAAREANLRCHLKENESQRTEVTGYINQLNIQLHRWQLRLQTLNDRNSELKAEIHQLSGSLGGDIHP